MKRLTRAQQEREWIKRHYVGETSSDSVVEAISGTRIVLDNSVLVFSNTQPVWFRVGDIMLNDFRADACARYDAAEST